MPTAEFCHFVILSLLFSEKENREQSLFFKAFSRSFYRLFRNEGTELCP